MDLIKELLSRIGILDVVSDYVSVRKIGKDWYAVCPFHSDTKPSLRIREDKGVFFCFGCNQGGNVINFVSRVHGISFWESAKLLADRYAPDISLDVDKKEYSLKREIIRANAHALLLFRKYLTTKEGMEAREYLKQRGVPEDKWQFFGIGFAPDNQTSVPAQLLKDGFSEEVLVNSGFIRKNELQLNCIFKNRITFPVNSVTDEVVGFSARTIKDQTPKYINSFENPVFKKRETFFGIPQAKEYIRTSGECLVAEGIFDVISLNLKGIHNSVSCLGTSLSYVHIAFLKKIASTVVLMFDGDDAGKKAVERNLSLFLRGGVIPYVVLIPDGMDPDSFIRSGGDILSIKRDDAILFVARNLYEKNKGDTIGISKSIRVVQELVSMLGGLSFFDIYVSELSKMFKVEREDFYYDVRKKMRTSSPSIKKTDMKNVSESEVLRIAVLNKDAVIYLTEDDLQYFTDVQIKTSLELLKKTGGDIALALSQASDEIRNVLITALFSYDEVPEVVRWEVLLESTIKRLKDDFIKKKVKGEINSDFLWDDINPLLERLRSIKGYTSNPRSTKKKEVTL